MTASPPTMFERNLAVLEAVDPALARTVAALSSPAGRLIADPSDPADLNLAIEGRVFYDAGTGARAHAARQVEDFLAHPMQLACPPLRHRTNRITDIMRTRVDDFVDRRGLPRDQPPGRHRGATLIVLGVGLGAHVDRLLDALDVRHVILVEPVVDLLRHSLHAGDWARWHEIQAARGGTLSVVQAGSAEDIAGRIHDRIMGTGLALIDGTFVYRHYSTDLLDQSLHLFYQQIDAVQGEGFFEDELLMFVNSTRNFLRPHVRLLVNRRQPAQMLPALIVAAGPSLDKALPDLARLRQSAVVFSAGSTISTLLNHGIEPDFHCEIENTRENYDTLAPLAAGRGFGATRLVASATVDARVPDLFGETLFYLRDTSMSSCVYGNADRTIFGTGPNCFSLALRMAERMGFREIYLFGADFGSRQADVHHVSDSIWVTDPGWSQKYDDESEPLAIRRPGNFGGRVYTNRLMLYFLESAERLVRHHHDVTHVNCSDGVRIAGAAPRLPGKVAQPPPGQAPAVLAGALAASAEIHTDGSLVDADRVHGFQERFAAWCDRVVAALDESRAAGGDLIAWHDAIRASAASLDERGRAMVQLLAGGSMISMYRHALHYAIRHDLVADDMFLAVVLEAFRDAIAEMRHRFDQAVHDELTRRPT